jgi:hypothetical protein
MANFPPVLRSALFGTPFGEVFPPKVNPTSLSIDGRTAALRVFKEYITNLYAFLPMQPGAQPKRFQIQPNNFYIEWPDHETDVVMPSAVVGPSRARYDVIGLVSYVEETTRDRYAPGTVLQWQGEYVEIIQLELWTSSVPERRSLLAAIETALSPTEQMSGLRFKMSEYFNELVCFTLQDRELLDDPMAPKNRRRAQLGIEMRFNIVALVNYNQFVPQFQVNTDVVQPSGNPVVIDPSTNPQARLINP